MASKKTSYVPTPTAAPSTLSRLDAVLKVQSGEMTVTQAAESVGLSRVRFQTLMNRSLSAMLDELEQKPGGRPSKDPQTSNLEEKVRQLEAENTQLSKKQEISERVIQNLAEMVREQSGIRRGRSRSTKSKKAKAATSDDAEEDAAYEMEQAMKLVGLGLHRELAALAVGSSSSTQRRRRARHREGVRLVNKRGPAPSQLRRSVLRRAAKRVRAVHGLIGCAALSRAIPGLSRRAAAVVKHDTLRAMERERKQRAVRVAVLEPALSAALMQCSWSLSRDAATCLRRGTRRSHFARR